MKAMLYLAKEGGSAPVLIQEIAREEGIPRKFLEAILLDLKYHGVLSSKKGKGGGYSLARPAHAISMGQVIRIMNGPLAPTPCVSKTAYLRCEECRDEKTCGIRALMKQVHEATAEILDSTTLADVMQSANRQSLHPVVQ